MNLWFFWIVICLWALPVAMKIRFGVNLRLVGGGSNFLVFLPTLILSLNDMTKTSTSENLGVVSRARVQNRCHFRRECMKEDHTAADMLAYRPIQLTLIPMITTGAGALAMADVIKSLK